jgi:hypothetical protein
MALAEASDRHFRMLWPRHYHCAATFQELFANDWNVSEEDAPPGTPIYGLDLGGARWRDFLTADDPHLVVSSGTWLARPELYPAHAGLMTRAAELLDELAPIPYVQQRVEHLRRDPFRPNMIGVHVRRGDFVYTDARDNLAAVLAAVDERLAVVPDAGIVLCTDDGAVHPGTGKPTRPEGVRDEFLSRFGQRVVIAEPRSLDRRTVEAVQDALVDFLLLRSTDYIVGTKRSSFSRLAVFGRTTPIVMCGSPEQRERAPLWAIISGVYPAVKLIGYLQYRHSVPYYQLMRHYRQSIQYRWRRLRGGRRM